MEQLACLDSGGAILIGEERQVNKSDGDSLT